MDDFKTEKGKKQYLYSVYRGYTAEVRKRQLHFRKQRIQVLFNPRIFYLPGTSNCSQKSLNIWIEILFYNIKFYNYSREHISLEFSVRPKPGFGIGNRNQDQVLVSVSEPKLLLPKPKLPPYSFLQFFSCFSALFWTSPRLYRYLEACM